MRRLGAQLYSIKEECEQDLLKTLEDVKNMGYDTVEFAGYYGNDVSVIRAKLDELGLEAISAHVGLELLINNLEDEISKLKTLGAKYIICPWAEIHTIEDAKKHALQFNEIGKICNEHDMVFAYHNHAHELVNIDGQYPLEVLFDNVNPEYVKQQVDVYWVAFAGLDPMEYVKAHLDRLVIVHLKQILSETDKANVEAKEGIIPFAQMMTLSDEIEFIYEQEYYKGSRLEEMQRSYEFIIG